MSGSLQPSRFGSNNYYCAILILFGFIFGFGRNVIGLSGSRFAKGSDLDLDQALRSFPDALIRLGSLKEGINLAKMVQTHIFTAFQARERYEWPSIYSAMPRRVQRAPLSQYNFAEEATGTTRIRGDVKMESTKAVDMYVISVKLTAFHQPSDNHGSALCIGWRADDETEPKATKYIVDMVRVWASNAFEDIKLMPSKHRKIRYQGPRRPHNPNTHQPQYLDNNAHPNTQLSTQDPSYSHHIQATTTPKPPTMPRSQPINSILLAIDRSHWGEPIDPSSVAIGGSGSTV
ncbi:hypothetical protein P691DRAFT_791152 [Macrolepiota fuliginosa MF-IS2]|uniref:Uncharacterized protein n=1 Tax=Macrolepiota fuliginosa MF-IS2 TaxID=1400762 RepID=A0A9P5WYU9_9AGAR|nr:hypothetical protein P691DRAFT_791152 [Macrolepiota fuliginosa MF-IS2]